MIAIEVKSGAGDSRSGMAAFSSAFGPTGSLRSERDGFPLGAFPERLVEEIAAMNEQTVG